MYFENKIYKFKWINHKSEGRKDQSDGTIKRDSHLKTALFGSWGAKSFYTVYKLQILSFILLLWDYDIV